MNFLIHYSEIALKQGNRKYFENRLIANILKNLKKSTGLNFSYKKLFGRIIIKLDQESKQFNSVQESIVATLQTTFGIANFAVVEIVEADVSLIQNLIIDYLKNQKFTTFRISARRANKAFHLNSQAINIKIGEQVVVQLGKKVKLENPDIECHIEIVGNIAYVYFNKIKGPGGLPVGVSGKALVLISGGFDSPVAAWYALKRGVQVEFIHFHSMPYTSKASLEKVQDLVAILEKYGASTKVYNIPFADIQKEVMINCPEKLRVILYRRLMMRIADVYAHRNNCIAFVTGEAVGQVASQTLENIRATGSVTNLPIIRPLVCFDKEEIIEVAKQIGTHDISKKPHDDACTRFIPTHPETKAKLKEVDLAEKNLNIQNILNQALRLT